MSVLEENVKAFFEAKMILAYGSLKVEWDDLNNYSKKIWLELYEQKQKWNSIDIKPKMPSPPKPLRILNKKL